MPSSLRAAMACSSRSRLQKRLGSGSRRDMGSGCVAVVMLNSLGHGPEQERMAVRLDGPVGGTVAKAEAVRHDARPGTQFREQLRRQPPVHVGKKEERHHRRLAQIGPKQILLAKLDEALHAGGARVAARA